MAKLRLESVDGVLRRVYYKRSGIGHRRSWLYCLQQEGNHRFVLYRCSTEGEPEFDNPVPISRFLGTIDRPRGSSQFENDARHWLDEFRRSGRWLCRVSYRRTGHDEADSFTRPVLGSPVTISQYYHHTYGGHITLEDGDNAAIVSVEFLDGPNYQADKAPPVRSTPTVNI